MDGISPFAALWTGIPGVFMLALVKYLSGWLRDALLGVGGLLVLFALVVIGIWAYDNAGEIYVRHLEDKCHARSITPELLTIEAKTKLAAEVGRLSPDGLNILAHRSGILTPDFELFSEEAMVGGVAWSFWCEFVKATTHDGTSERYWLCPISRWGSGTTGQINARRITDHLVAKKLAIESRANTQWTGGNRSAEWLSRDVYVQVYKWFFDKEPKE